MRLTDTTRDDFGSVFYCHEHETALARIVVRDQPPYVMTRSTFEGLSRAIEKARSRKVRGVIIGIGCTPPGAFGGELEFRNPTENAELIEIIAAIENLGKPVVAALHHYVQGEVLELALACHARIATAGAMFRFAEPRLGSLPTTGAMQRLARLAGLESAKWLLAQTKDVAAAVALDHAAIDRVVHCDGIGQASAFLVEALDRQTLFQLASHRPGYATAVPAPLAPPTRAARRPQPADEAISQSLTGSAATFDEAVARERALVLAAFGSPASKALRYLAWAEHRASSPAEMAAEPLASAAVIGAGTMGAGIAVALADAGVDVHLVDTHEAALERGYERCSNTFRHRLSQGRLSQEQFADRMARITPLASVGNLPAKDLIIEAVFEDLAAKQAIFREIDKIAVPHTILASNTSTLNIDLIAEATGRPTAVLGMHFFSPADTMKLVEVIPGAATTASNVSRTVAYAKQIGKIPVTVGNCDGFVGNRMTAHRALQLELMLQEGALPWEIDRVLVDFGYPMGPFAVGDLSGLDIGQSVRRRRGIHFPIADAVVNAGRTGQKGGKGWYDYVQGPRAPVPSPEVQEILERVSADLGIQRRALPADEIVDRCILPMINEGARVLEEGMASRGSDIDVIFVHGFGWPGFRGGPLYYADHRGLGEVISRLTSLTRIEPTALLKRLAAPGSQPLHQYSVPAR